MSDIPLSQAYLDILAGGEAEKHRKLGLACTCGQPIWTDYHQAVMVGRAVAAALAAAHQ